MTTENTIRDKANTTNTHNPRLTPAENNPDQFKVNAGNLPWVFHYRKETSMGTVVASS